MNKLIDLSRDELSTVFTYLDAEELLKKCAPTCKVFQSVINTSSHLLFREIIEVKAAYKKLIEQTKKNKLLVILKKIVTRKKVVPLPQDYELKRSQYLYLKNFSNTNNLFMSLFDGKNNFLQLPIFNTGSLQASIYDYGSIKPSMLTAPIMRGTSKDGIVFIAIKVTENRKNYDVKIFAQMKKNSSTWFHTGRLPYLDGYIIDSGIAHYKSRYQAIKKLIKTGSCFCPAVKYENGVFTHYKTNIYLSK